MQNLQNKKVLKNGIAILLIAIMTSTVLAACNIFNKSESGTPTLSISFNYNKIAYGSSAPLSIKIGGVKESSIPKDLEVEWTTNQPDYFNFISPKTQSTRINTFHYLSNNELNNIDYELPVRNISVTAKVNWNGTELSDTTNFDIVWERGTVSIYRDMASLSLLNPDTINPNDSNDDWSIADYSNQNYTVQTLNMIYQAAVYHIMAENNYLSAFTSYDFDSNQDLIEIINIAYPMYDKLFSNDFKEYVKKSIEQRQWPLTHLNLPSSTIDDIATQVREPIEQLQNELNSIGNTISKQQYDAFYQRYQALDHRTDFDIRFVDELMPLTQDFFKSVNCNNYEKLAFINIHNRTKSGQIMSLNYDNMFYELEQNIYNTLKGKTISG